MNTLEEVSRLENDATRAETSAKRTVAKAEARAAEALARAAERQASAETLRTRYAAEVAARRKEALPAFFAAPLRIFDDRDKLCGHWEICRMRTPWLSHGGAKPDAPAHYFPVPKHPKAGPATCPSCDADVWRKCYDAVTVEE